MTKDIITRLTDAHRRVELWPEQQPCGYGDLLELRNLVPEAIAEIRRLRSDSSDQTWWRLVLFDPASKLYYEYSDHGKPSLDPMGVDAKVQSFEDLLPMEHFARKDFPGVAWEVRRIRIVVEPFDPTSETTLRGEAIRIYRERIIAKLNPWEAEALGVEKKP
jgi:hypothetical protein